MEVRPPCFALKECGGRTLTPNEIEAGAATKTIRYFEATRGSFEYCALS